MFLLQTKKLGDFRAAITREQTAMIQASSTLTLTAESAGTVENIRVKEGQSVHAGASLIQLQDSLTHYDLLVAQAKNGLTLQETNAETTRVNLENSIAQAEMAYKQALQNYQNLQNRNGLQYDTLVQKNKDTLKTYNDAYRNFLRDLDGAMTQYLYEADRIIGASSDNEYRVGGWRHYLGANSGIGTSKAEDAWNTLYTARGAIRSRLESKASFTESDTEKDIEIANTGYQRSRELANAMIDMLQNSVFGAGLSLEMQSGWLAAWNGHRLAIQGSEGSFIQWKTQTNAFLENYKKQEIATKIAVDSLGRGLSGEEFNTLQADSELKLNFNNAQLSLKENIDAAKLALDTATTALENAKKLRDATLNQLRASTENARLAVTQAERNAAKLTLTAPIAGVVTKIHAEVGQNVNVGTPLAEFAGKNPQSLVEVTPRTALMLSVGDTVSAVVNDTTLTGSISAVSRIAGKNMLASVRIAFPNGEAFIGQGAKITFHLPSTEDSKEYFLIPLNAVTILAE